jgi:predicted outer membrane protein
MGVLASAIPVRRRPRRLVRISWIATTAVLLLLSGGLDNMIAAHGAVSGAVNDADRDLLTRVRQAGLWETPAGRMAAEKGESKRVREIGEMIADQHEQLDQLVVAAAGRLGVALPDEPTPDQKAWLAEMEAAEGEAFDRVFVDRLRRAHGQVFPIIGDRRAYTSNDVVRRLAQDANGFVLNHMGMLESTDLVSAEALSTAPAAPREAAPARSGVSVGGLGAPLVWIVLAVTLIGGSLASAWLTRLRWAGGRGDGNMRL